MLLRITRQISNPNDLEELLRRIISAIRINGIITTQINADVKFFLNKDFNGEEVPFQADIPVFIDPEAKEPGLNPQTLTLRNTLNLIQSSFNAMNSGEFRQFLTGKKSLDEKFYIELKKTYDFLEKEKGIVQHNEGFPKNRAEFIVEIAELLLETLEVLTEDEEVEEEETFERSEEMPDWLSEINTKLLKDHWEPVAEVISIEGKEGFLDEAIEELKGITEESKFPGVELRSKSETVSIIALRNFLNEWAHAIIDEDRTNPFPNAIKIFDQNELKSLVFFPSSTTNSVAQDDLEKIQALDLEAIQTFKEVLLKALEKYKNRKDTPEPTGDATAPAGEDAGGDEQQPVTPVPQTPAEVDQLRKDVLEYQHYVKEEVVRVQSIALNFVLAFNNFPKEVPSDLASSEPFRYLQREINTELLELLNRDPHALDDPNRRAIVIRSFLFRLMANPKFQTYLALVKDRYAAVEALKHPDLTAEQVPEFKKQFIEAFEKNKDADVEELFQEIYAKLKVEEIPDLTAAQRKELIEQLKARLSRNQTTNIALFLAEANADLKVGAMVELTGAEQVALRKTIVDELLANPTADINSVLQSSFLALKASQFANISQEQQDTIVNSVIPKLTRNQVDHVDDILNESYAALVFAGIPDLDLRQKNELKQELLAALSKNPRANLDNIIEKFSQKISAGPGFNPDFNLNNLTQAHFERVMMDLYGMSDVDVKKIFEGMDLLMYMRISSDRVSRLTTDENTKIFEVNFSQLTVQQQKELGDIFAAYLVLRRNQFERRFNVVTLSQAQDAQQEGKALTPAELTLILATREQIHSSGLQAKHFATAAALTPSQLKNFENSGQEDASEVKQADNIQIDVRKQVYASILQEIAASNDREQIQQLALQTGIQLRQDEVLSAAQIQGFFNYLEGVADLSQYELESGIVLDNANQIVRTAIQAEAAYRGGSEIKPGLTALKAITDEGAALLGGAAAGAILPGVGLILPKAVKETIGKAIVVGGAVTAGTGLVTALEVASQFGVVGLGGVFGGVGGALLGVGGGPLGIILGATGGAIAGAGGAAAASNGLFTGILGSGSGAFGTQSSQVPNIPGLLTHGTSSGGNYLTKFASGFKHIVTQTPAGAATAGYLGIAVLGSTLVFSTFFAAFIPPDIIGTQATQNNKYVSVSKTADPSTAENPALTKAVTYTVNIATKPGYTIEITNISDSYTVATKDKSTPTVTNSKDFSSEKTTLDATTTSKTIQYAVNFDNKFKDSLVTNTIQVTFNATGNGASLSDSTTATAAVCFGDCPKPAAGCWPSSGRDGQDPFGAGDHAALGEDAFDISAPAGTPIYAPFAGTVCAKYMEGTKTPPIKWGFGNYLTLHADGTSYDFLFGHLSQFGPGLELNNCSNGGGLHVQPGDLIGYIGNTGSSFGNHLHYQLGIYPPRSSPPSVLRKLIPPADENIRLLQPIKSCYDRSGDAVTAK